MLIIILEEMNGNMKCVEERRHQSIRAPLHVFSSLYGEYGTFGSGGLISVTFNGSFDWALIVKNAFVSRIKEHSLYSFIAGI